MAKTFQDDKGNNSSMRMMCFVSLLAAIGFAYMTMRQIFTATISYDLALIAVYIVFGFLLAAFAPKAVQKFAERLPTK